MYVATLLLLLIHQEKSAWVMKKHDVVNLENTNEFKIVAYINFILGPDQWRANEQTSARWRTHHSNSISYLDITVVCYFNLNWSWHKIDVHKLFEILFSLYAQRTNQCLSVCHFWLHWSSCHILLWFCFVYSATVTAAVAALALLGHENLIKKYLF